MSVIIPIILLLILVAAVNDDDHFKPISIILLLLFASATCGAQEWVNTSDSGLHYREGYVMGSMSASDTKTGRIIEYKEGDLFLIHNYKSVPMGFCCDTIISSSGLSAASHMKEVTVTIFMNRKVVVLVRSIMRYDWSWDAYVDTSFFSRSLDLR